VNYSEHRSRGCCPPRGSCRSFPRPTPSPGGLCDRFLSAFHIGGADLRIIRTADSVHAIAAHVAVGTGITVESALNHGTDRVPAAWVVSPIWSAILLAELANPSRFLSLHRVYGWMRDRPYAGLNRVTGSLPAGKGQASPLPPR
jgi:hypothetical protein